MENHDSQARILFRMQTNDNFEWRVSPVTFDSIGARHIALKLKILGIGVVVCPDDEYVQKGVPITFNAQEYFEESDASTGSARDASSVR
ncbi:MAG: hypothetical protein GY922_12150 [Proteobacteria bacterium]|jgi:hypothetical protein|nr:hypothetical protein [Pseudomonadota bacterium]